MDYSVDRDKGYIKNVLDDAYSIKYERALVGVRGELCVCVLGDMGKGMCGI